MKLLPILRLFAELCLFRQRPENFPVSQHLLVIAGALYLGVLFVWPPIPTRDISSLLFCCIANTILPGAVWFFILRLRGVGMRWKQTALAMFGALTITHLIGSPFYADVNRLMELVLSEMESVKQSLPQATLADVLPTEIPKWSVYMAYAVDLWQLTIQAWILSQAIEIRTALGFLIVVAYSLPLYMVTIYHSGMFSFP